ncbi:MAG: phosphotransferase [Gammaproteobacteria bacterium]|nr:phosphotransferase [Gammaproteobacteria bacterium]
MWNEMLGRFNHQVTVYQFADLWNADLDSLRLMNQGINIVYRFETKGMGRYLKVTHAKLRNKNAMECATDYLHHLFINGAQVCQPVQSIRGNFVEEVNQDKDVFIGMVMEEACGAHFDFDLADERACAGWGISLGKMHRAAQSYQPLFQKCHFLTWYDLIAELRQYLNREDEKVQKAFSEVVSWLEKLQQTKENFGLIHTDNRSANTIWDGEKAVIIDFDEPVYHWFAQDVAKPLLEFCDKPKEKLDQFFKYYIAGYRSVRSFSEEEVSTLSWFVRLKDLDMYLWTKNNWSSEYNVDGADQKSILQQQYQRIINPKEFDFLSEYVK